MHLGNLKGVYTSRESVVNISFFFTWVYISIINKEKHHNIIFFHFFNIHKNKIEKYFTKKNFYSDITINQSSRGTD